MFIDYLARGNLRVIWSGVFVWYQGCARRGGQDLTGQKEEDKDRET